MRVAMKEIIALGLAVLLVSMVLTVPGIVTWTMAKKGDDTGKGDGSGDEGHKGGGGTPGPPPATGPIGGNDKGHHDGPPHIGTPTWFRHHPPTIHLPPIIIHKTVKEEHHSGDGGGSDHKEGYYMTEEQYNTMKMVWMNGIKRGQFPEIDKVVDECFGIK